MTDDLDQVAQKAGLPPGTPSYVGEPHTAAPTIRALWYDEEQLVERQGAPLDEALAPSPAGQVLWLDIAGLHDVALVEAVGQRFGLHPLVMEDILNTAERPKLDDLGDSLYIVLKALYYDERDNEVVDEQISLVLGPGYLLSFQESKGEDLESVRERIRTGRGRIRAQGADYLLYSILDRIVDDYFIVLERLGDRIEGLEDELVQDPRTQSLQAIYALKREMITMRRAAWPLREVLGALQRMAPGAASATPQAALVQRTTAIYLRDLYDHTMHVMETVETFRDMLSGMLDIYLSSISNRMNEIMKVLTMVGTLFIPLTFLAGVYGMNFRYFPEIGWSWGYPLFWVLSIGIAIGMGLFFRRKRWL
jgi:magnesium transporter